ncbi:MAG: hypothetical protein CVU57_17955 [Deltaproteobacteria bacterium HGW-Deltaproteobacteria-15]|nr:MAG: hypothetical protein CVU57_17955 [Deltaproteobacteria bacterium HGW-Deltaproteobacteria-15]
MKTRVVIDRHLGGYTVWRFLYPFGSSSRKPPYFGVKILNLKHFLSPFFGMPFESNQKETTMAFPRKAGNAF